jgi:transposase
VVGHDSGRLVWAAPGRDKATLAAFFDALGEEPSAQIAHVSADGVDWISDVVAQRCSHAVRCADPFPIVKWATEALDEVRRQAWNEARGAVTRRRAGRASGPAKALKHARYALSKNPEPLTARQQAKLAWVAKTDPRVHVPTCSRRGLRVVFQLPYAEAVEALEVWIGWARQCRIPVFVDLQRRIVKHRASILAAISTASPMDVSSR